MTDLIGRRELTAAVAMIVRFAGSGVPTDQFMRFAGLDPEEMRKMAREAAEEEFMTIPGLPPGVPAEGRLRRLPLSASQRETVKQALEEGWLSALQAGVSLGRVLEDQDPKVRGRGTGDG